MKQIKYLVMDVDGTLTDGKIYMSDDGEFFKVFDIKDGCGIRDLLPKLGIMPVVMTARESRIVKNRCIELGIIHCYQGCRDKPKKLVELANNVGLKLNTMGTYSEIAYIGDDLSDIPCMCLCKITGCPADAAEEVKNAVQFVSSKNGGDGAVREFIEWLFKSLDEKEEK